MARPRFQITDEVIRQIETLSGYGLTLIQVAAVIGISERTLTRLKTNEEKVLSAVVRGKARAETFVGKTLFERAKDGDISAIRWWESTRAGRVAAIREIHEGVPQSPVTVTIALPDWTALIRSDPPADAA